MARNAVPVLRMRGITKRFPGVLALENVDFEVHRGEVHLLLGENGAGKSTLMKVLSGAHAKDAGTIELDGRRVDMLSPHHSSQLGVSMIYQEMNLVPNLTVADNIYLGREPSRFGFIRRGMMERNASRHLKRLHAGMPASSLVRDLPVARQQLVEISKALSLKSRIVVMDEPTSPLSQREVRDLFRIIRSLKREGVAIIYITHRLEEGRAIGDQVTVLRDGRRVGTHSMRQVSNSRLVGMMVGRKLSQVFPAVRAPGNEEALEVRRLEKKGVFGPVSFAVRRGEIFGLSGLIGSGRTELARSLIGADRPSSGQVLVGGKPASINSPRDARRLGLCLLPEDRKAHGLVLAMSVLHNVSLASLAKLSRLGLLKSKAERAMVSSLASRLDVRTPGLDQIAANLSGGNQQKLVLAKWLAVEPRVLVFDEPTRGIDVGAKVQVYRLIASLARQGAAIIMISSELPEILGLSHRVGIMRDGRLSAVLPRRRASAERVMRYAMGLPARA